MSGFRFAGDFKVEYYGIAEHERQRIVARLRDGTFRGSLRRPGRTLSEPRLRNRFPPVARSAPRGGGLSSRVHPSGAESRLFRTTRFVAAKAVRTEQRRLQREREAMEIPSHSSPSAWDEAEPLLDEAVSRLGTSDRDAILLRFFQNKSHKEIDRKSTRLNSSH